MTDLVLVTHGTREATGVLVATDIAVALRADLPGTRVHLAFTDVRAPNVTDVLRQVDGPAVVVPAFLSSGYHVRVDVPGQVARSGHPGVVLAAPPGPAAALVEAAHQRLRAAGLRRRDAVVLAAAGSSDPRALADVGRAAAQLSARTGGEVRIGYLTTAWPNLADAVAGTGRRVAVATWLLAPGLFHRRVIDCGAPVIADPIGAHPLLVKELSARYRAACAHRAAARVMD
ncbi:MAG TPA: CbiX/SirB N-terminal domain-containing protein [Pseudonocardiaceae bacterium]|nr:CbiX/SirB N-terminal domain-containing protein [Pseudonocardiaceae bacterium]